MTIYDNVQKYLYMGREILDYSGKNLGVMLIRLSETNIWGKLAASMVTEEGGAIYILDRNNNILMAYSGNGIAGNRIHGLYYVIFFQKARQTSG